MEFVLSEDRTDALRAEVARLSKRAVKLGVPSPVLTVVETTPQKFGWQDAKDETLYAAFRCVIENPIVSLSDYSFSARIDHNEGIVTAMREGYAHKYRDALPVCEHCGENRQRNTTYVFTDSHGKDMQVGSTCLKDFSGYHNAEQIANLLTLYYQLENDYSEESESNFGGGGSRRINTREYLALVNVAITQEGWVPKSAVEFGGMSTSSLAMRFYYPPVNAKADDRATASETDYARADAAIGWAQGENESTNDYILTISNLAHKEYFDPKYSGFVASIIPAFDRAESRKVEIREREKAQAEIIPEIYAPVGTRVRDIPVTVTNVRHFDSDYGVSTLVNMRTADNHALSWFASNDPEIAIGESATLTGTVKGYDEKYRATKLTRCKLI